MIQVIDGHFLLSLAFEKVNIADPERTLKRLRSISSHVEVQLVKADLIAGPEHLQFAARNAIYSFKGERRRSKSLAMELLLYLSCQRQIAKAVMFLGVDSKDSRVALFALSPSKGAIEQLGSQAEAILDGEPNDSEIEIGSKRKMVRLQESYGVTAKEMEAARLQGETEASVLKRLIVERSAFLDIDA